MAQKVMIILPTYNEVENIGVLVPKICKYLTDFGLTFSLLVVDDNSPDGTADKVRTLSEMYPVNLIVRKKPRSLSGAVMEGFLYGDSEVCVVMDADGSHPFEKIPDMVTPILNHTCLISVGVRYVQRSDTSHFSFFRKCISLFSGGLARGLTSLSDPTSGFMAIRRSSLESLSLNPIGWKIVLELVVKLNDPNMIEVPITFKDRLYGQSKFFIKEGIDYLRHLWRLYLFKYSGFFEFFKFGWVGLCGVVVDLAIVYMVTEYAYASAQLSASLGFLVAVVFNYIFHRLWTFKFSNSPYLQGLFKFILTSLGGLFVRLLVITLLLDSAIEGVMSHYLYAHFIGIFVGFLFNFFVSKRFVFNF